jgi:hypothetical protein
MEKFHALLDSEHDSLQTLYDNVKHAQQSNALEINAITITIAELSKFVSLHDQLESLANGVDSMALGHLSPKILTPRQLYTTIIDINNELRKQGAKLCFSTP